MTETATEKGSSPKRIILCLDGTFDDTADTTERVNPGSSVSRFFRWILPPILFMILWGSGLFPSWKRLEWKLFGLPPNKKFFHTNVSLLASAIKSHGHREGLTAQIPQLVMYIGGIGAVGNPQSRFEEATTGNTMTYKVRHAYRLIVDNYCPGDEIFLFGFSRGAFTARAIAGFINWAGLLKKDRMTENFDEIWDTYRSRVSGQAGVGGQDFEHTATIMLKNGLTIGDIRHDSNRLRCVGVWDTVGSLGAPPIRAPSQSDDFAVAKAAQKRYIIFDPALKNNVDHAFQALALDEQRFDFYPAVWNKPDHMDCRSFGQVWFPGVHTDVGGGRTGSISRYAFIWMVSRIQECGLLELNTDFIQRISKGLRRSDEGPGTTPPWELEIGHCHWVYSLLGRLRFRNPNMPIQGLLSQEHGDAEDSDNILSAEQKFHWTVIERINKPNSTYWIDCKALSRVNPLKKSHVISPEEIRKRQDEPVGEDQMLREHWRMENIEDEERQG